MQDGTNMDRTMAEKALAILDEVESRNAIFHLVSLHNSREDFKEKLRLERVVKMRPEFDLK